MRRKALVSSQGASSGGAQQSTIAQEQQLQPTQEIYVSADIEANGPCPGLFSMLSFGLAAFTIEKRLVGTFTRNLELLDGAGTDERTTQWWALTENAEAYRKSRENPVSPRTAMVECREWLEQLKRFGKPIVCGAPSGFDFTFLYYYFQRELGSSPVGFASLDLRSYAAAVMKKQYRQVGKRQYPAEWIDDGLPHTHVALDDAIEQGCILINMMRDNLGLPHVSQLVDAR
ncbi:MAG: 3'-5' exoribonuclease [Candidatus Eremiobacteraeota bacterium]|nr:3'-5' exoribonuclease [Candidatus Eremiobacteraeota bacterium]